MTTLTWGVNAQRTIENMQSDIMALQRTVQQLTARQEARLAAEQAVRQAQPGPRANALQPLEDNVRLRRGTPPSMPEQHQQLPQQLPGQAVSAIADVRPNDKSL